MPLFAPAGGGSSIGDWSAVQTVTTPLDVTNSNTPTVVPELAITLLANSMYLIEYNIIYRSNTLSSGMTWRVTGPAADHANLIIGNYYHLVDAANAYEGTGKLGTSTTAWGLVASGIPNTALDCPLRICLMWPVDSAGGTLDFRQANTNADTGRTTSVRAGSFMRIKRMT